VATDLSLNYVGDQFQLQVGGVPVWLTLPTYFDPTTNQTVPITPRHALIYTDQPIRWRAGDTDPNPAMGMLVLGGATINWLDPQIDYNALIQRVRFVTDTSATQDATLEVALFN